MNESLEGIRLRAKHAKEDDRKEYAAKKKYGKTYKQFMDKLDDREEYKNKMKYGKDRG